MWQYNHSEELCHHGILGMKWGHRTAHPVSETRAVYDKAKTEKRSAAKAYNKAFAKASTNPINGWTKKGQEKWGDVSDKAKTLGEANKNLADAKAKRKKAIDNAQAEVDKQTPILKNDGWLYNEATNRKAAQYVVDHNMTVSEARTKARKESWRNTAAVFATIGVLSVASLKS